MDRTCDPCRVKGNTISRGLCSQRERTPRMGRKRRETPEECTENAQGLPLAWGGYIIRPTDPKLSPLKVPNACGVYAWYSREGDLLYVGRSKSMGSRIRKHHMPEWGGALLSYRLVPEKYIAGVEMAHVKTLEPYHNEARESADLPFWDAMCAAIYSSWRDTWPQMYERVCARESAIAQAIAVRL